MKKRCFIYQMIIGLITFSLMSITQAGLPVLTFTPITSTSQSVVETGNVTIQYQVTNQSQHPHTFALLSVPGVNQTTTPGNCANPFILFHQHSCTLTLTISGNTLTSQGITAVTRGPTACQSDLNGIPNPNLCYGPLPKDELNIQVISLFPNGSSCTDNSQCKTNSCIPATQTCGFCISNSDCGLGNFCSSNGLCLSSNGNQCLTSANCITGSVCNAGLCVAPNGASCFANAACQSGACSTTSHTCQGKSLGATCTSNKDCQSNFCNSGVCSTPNNGVHCTSNAECLTNYCTPSNTCGAPNTGQACTTGATCQSGVCIAGSCTAPAISCSTGSACPTGQVCSSGHCVNACVPRTCGTLTACGPISDGCGGLITCNSCPSGQTCGGGGVPYQCSATGGACTSNAQCVARNPATPICNIVTNQCVSAVCTPLTCAQQGFNCGAAGNGCGGTITCGTCSGGQICGLGGLSRCG
ncbi:hypothetical protein BN59_01559 [Legionella massiliensis]|uniref:Uncharacterized protein n=1 Tax=Legionella massiliensis TaxID=1034943 RepID=A0A078KW96_9GAMM|nr:Dickkopf N-terminal cysteine-rich domain-containing protein [Legionella massiliensis]CDZ77277.1 hypothetical protein BN59_01559 [Legionella massiliensis]CEE13015.1 hypothetical protein BN1094_01559 [Legionella massiliensis]